jgi:hypothetical protein
LNSNVNFWTQSEFGLCQRVAKNDHLYSIEYPPRFGFLSSILIVIASLMVLRFAWRPIVMAFVLLGVTLPSAMAAVIIGGVILSTAAHCRVVQQDQLEHSERANFSPGRAPLG